MYAVFVSRLHLIWGKFIIWIQKPRKIPYLGGVFAIYTDFSIFVPQNAKQNSSQNQYNTEQLHVATLPRIYLQIKAIVTYPQ